MKKNHYGTNILKLFLQPIKNNFKNTGKLAVIHCSVHSSIEMIYAIDDFYLITFHKSLLTLAYRI